MKNIGERLRFLREAKGLSMNQLEDSIGAARGSVNKWEKGSIPGGKFLILLSDFFEVPTDWILKGETKVSKGSVEQTSELSPSDIELLAKFHQLPEKQQGIIEGRIEEMLATQVRDSAKESYPSKNGNGREEVATKQGA